MSHPLHADIRFILDNQRANGAYVASPAYSQYPYCWLRDGSFIAHAMDRAGEPASARAFHGWVAKALAPLEGRIRALIEAKATGAAIDHAHMPPARFTLDGLVEHDDWPSFQIDGYGQWLWSLERHARTTPELPREIVAAATTVADYLVAFWNEPCYDAWEEGRTQQHTSMLASACAGLGAAAALLGGRYGERADEAWRSIGERCRQDGHFVKAVRNREVDASLLWLATPFDLTGDDDPSFARTLERIERELVADGGVMRYRADTFYGGGAWILLTAWLGWHHARAGRPERARPWLDWVERQRGADGGLPEQVPTERSDAWFERYWTERWGPSARPLLWSHAMLLLARLELTAQTAAGEAPLGTP